MSGVEGIAEARRRLGLELQRLAERRIYRLCNRCRPTERWLLTYEFVEEALGSTHWLAAVLAQELVLRARWAGARQRPLLFAP